MKGNIENHLSALKVLGLSSCKSSLERLLAAGKMLTTRLCSRKPPVPTDQAVFVFPDEETSSR